MSTVTRTTPYAWPYDGALDAGRFALVVAGADTGWAARVTDHGDRRPALHDLAAGVIAAGGMVVCVRHPAPHPVSAIVLPGAVAVEAGGIDGFYAGPLDGVLRAAGRDRLALAGYGLEGPVHSTLRSANDRGYECLTLRDACAPIDPACEDAAYSSIEMSGGIFGAVGTAAHLLYALQTPRPEELA